MENKILNFFHQRKFLPIFYFTLIEQFAGRVIVHFTCVIAMNCGIYLKQQFICIKSYFIKKNYSFVCQQVMLIHF